MQKIARIKRKRKKVKKSYKTKEITIPGRGVFKTTYNIGEGDCFFHSVRQVLEKLGLPNYSTQQLRIALSDWFMDPRNQTFKSLDGSRYPEDIIPNLTQVGIYVPQGGWASFLRNKNWDF